jgi:hypothetical protein
MPCFALREKEVDGRRGQRRHFPRICPIRPFPNLLESDNGIMSFATPKEPQ